MTQYRAGNYDAAIEACLRSIELSPKQLQLSGPHPSDYAFLAMSHFQIGNWEDSMKYYELLIEVMKLDAFQEDKECFEFVKEADVLFRGRSKPGSSK